MVSLNGLVNGLNGSLNNNNNTPGRPLALTHGALRVQLAVPEPDWVAASILREAFADSLAQDEDAQAALTPLELAAEDEESQANNNSSNSAAAQRNQALLLALFLRFTADHLHQDASRTDSYISVLLSAYAHLVHTYLAGSDLHSYASALEPPQRRLFFRAFYEARSSLQSHGHGDNLPTPQPSLLFTQSQGLQAVFGGQGLNEIYFDEMQMIYDQYAPLLLPTLQAAEAALASLAQQHASTLHYTFSMKPLSWLQNPESRPPVPYLASCAVSLPLIGLTQLSQYVVTAKILGLTPKEMAAKFKGATGHSQGVVTAAMMAIDLDGTDAWDSFNQIAAHKALKMLFYLGLRGTEAFPTLALAPSVVKDCVDGGEGVPTPMLAVTALARDTLQKHIDGVNKHLTPGKNTIQISLYNGLKAHVVTGPPASLAGLVKQLRKIKAESGKDQSKVPFSKRLPVFSLRFLPVGVPYHSHYLEGCTAQILKDIGEEDVQWWERRKLTIPVFNTEDGSDLRQPKDSSSGLAQDLCDLICTQPIHWVHATTYDRTVSHVVDFGPGGVSGIGSLIAREQEGTGLRVVFASAGTAGRGNEETYSSSVLRVEPRWSEKFTPRLIRTLDGKIRLDTPMSRLLSKAPLMVAGMTPSTVQAGFVAATLNAGYHIELAGGGHYNEKALRAKVDEISKQFKTPGLAVTLNSLYINQRQWTFQFPLWQQMCQEGLPVEGLCVAAGIPSIEKSVEIIDGLRSAGIKHVSFKPGSVDGIRQVVNIAANNPDFPIMMQWTGGRAGGHHSPEDMHQPILNSYNSIRQHPNLILIAGSGFGGADDVWPYLTGEWSTKFGVQPMPYDGFLFASRVMVAKEAHTSEPIKQLIVDAPGVEDDKWEQTYDKPTGGILTVTSELGEPIHKIANRGIKLWKEFDDTVFGLPKEKRAAWLAQKKDYVIQRLNADFQKPWFGQKEDGKACDLEEMTYGETINRMVRLMFIKSQGRWVDVSLRNLVGDWIRRTEERLSHVSSNKSGIESELQSFSELDNPESFLERFYARYPTAKKQILASTDARYFLAICQRPGQKPVPFIPVLDADFGVWFKKDSLWYSENIEAVFDQDPGRVCVLQGPVAVRHSKRTDEPIGELLGNIENALIAKVLEKYYDNDESKVPQEEYLARVAVVSSDDLAAKYGIQQSVEEHGDGSKTYLYDLSKALPPQADWLEMLAGPKPSWLRAFLTNVSFVQGSKKVPNQVSKVFAPRHNQRVKMHVNAQGQPLKVELFGAIRSSETA